MPRVTAPELPSPPSGSLNECRALTPAPDNLQALFDADPERTLSILHRITAQDATTFIGCKKKQENLAAYIRRLMAFYKQVQADINEAEL